MLQKLKIAGGFLLAFLVLSSCGVGLWADTNQFNHHLDFVNGCKADGLRVEYDNDKGYGQVWCFDRNDNHLVRHFNGYR